MATKREGSFWELIKTILYAVLIAVVFRTFAYEPFNIPSGSMIPTLLVGDFLFVSKFSYGFSRYSLPFGLPLFSGRILAQEPEVGDVAVFKFPADNSTDYIKRVVGRPGDSIQMINGLLYINGTNVPRRLVDEFVARDSRGRLTRYWRYIETLPNGREHYILEEGDNGPLDNTPLYVVPPDHFFMMGDNRDSSQDSRVMSEVGFVPFVNFVGRAEFIFFSISGSFWNVPQWPESIRFDRIFQTIN